MWNWGTLDAVRAEVDYRRQQVRDDLAPSAVGRASSRAAGSPEEDGTPQDGPGAPRGPGPGGAGRGEAVPAPRSGAASRRLIVS